MHFPKKEDFLNEVISYIKFPFDRPSIKSELEIHILEKINDYLEEGYDVETAEEMAINIMGDPKEIGVDLNKEHNPLIGWIWKITNVIIIVLAIFSLFFLGAPLLHSVFSPNPINDIPKSDIVYKLDINEKVQMDDRVIHFTDLIFEKNGNMNIIYESYPAKFRLLRWNFSSVGKITDNLDNSYFSGSLGGGGLIKSKYITKIENFPKEANTLIIDYDYYNRKYKVEIPLQVGDNNE